MFIRLRLMVFMLLGALTLLLADAALAAEPGAPDDLPVRWTRAQGVAAVARLPDNPRHAPPNGRQRWPGFILRVTPEQVDICRGNDAWFTVHADQMTGFSDPITLDVSGQPAGTGSSFAPNPLTPPGSSLLTISDTAAAALGRYQLTVVGSSGSQTGHDTVILTVSNVAPALPTLLAPADGALHVAVRPTFTWNMAAYATAYDIEVGTDVNFATVVAAAGGVIGAAWTPPDDLDPGVVYFWRVRALNGCGITPYSVAFSFTTAPATPPTGVQLSRLAAGSRAPAVSLWLPAGLITVAAVIGVAVGRRRL